MKVKPLLAITAASLRIFSACGQAIEVVDQVPVTVAEKSADETMMKDEDTPAGSMMKGDVSSTLVPPANSPLPDNPNLGLTFDTDNLRDIYLAGGCFWGVEAYMARIYGVYDVTSGYANGDTMEPSYSDVLNGSGHAEAVHVRYDPQYTDLETLLDLFFIVVDPTSLNKQGNDIGESYRSGIYYTDEADLTVIDVVIAEQAGLYSKDIVVEVEPLDGYYLAEDYHQDYLEKNPNGYCHIEFDSIEEQELPSSAELYTKPSDEEIRSKLTDLQYRVTQEEGTERSFENEYWDNKEDGIYVDIVSGEPLFSSATKYVSGTGWPSFWAPIDEEFIVLEEDNKLLTPRTEVRSTYGDSHLGHVFKDGPQETTGLRYCMNSAAMEFIPYDEMDARGYGDYKVYVKAE
jgi:peptide methionine sulfoxide reductase msrA/msrB